MSMCSCMLYSIHGGQRIAFVCDHSPSSTTWTPKDQTQVVVSGFQLRHLQGLCVISFYE